MANRDIKFKLFIERKLKSKVAKRLNEHKKVVARTLFSENTDLKSNLK